MESTYSAQKQQIYAQIVNQTKEKIALLQQTLAANKESRNSETKSTAGDKHETSRALVQTEIEKNETQLSLLIFSLKELEQLEVHTAFATIRKGAFVITNQGNYLIAIGIGKVAKKTYALSLLSPLGALLKDKKAGDRFVFQNNEIHIQAIV